MRAKALVAAGLDAGSERTRCVLLALSQDELRFLGYGEAASEGWKRGQIEDAAALSHSFRAAIQGAEKMAGVAVDAVCLGIGGASVRGGVSRASLDWGRHKEVDQDLINRLIERALRVSLAEDEMVLHAFPQSFRIDGRPGFRSPLGHVAARLEVDVYLITCSAQEHHALVGAANQAHVAVEETVFEPIAAAYAAILPEDRRGGIALVDIGKDSTKLVVYDHDALLLARSLRLSGDHLTRDVARGLRVNYQDAELLKREYGCALLDLTAENSYVEIPSVNGNGEHREEPRRKLNLILEARAEELFERVAAELEAAGLPQGLANGVVLTGGGSLLYGMWDLAERILQGQALTGLPVGITEWPEQINNAAWTTAAGLAMYSARLKLLAEKERRRSGLLARLLRW